jgi:hypothetical protein
MRAAGLAAELFGWGGLLLTDSFWPGIFCVYVGFVLLATDLWFEPQIQRGWRIAGVAIISVLGTLFSLGIVFISVPLHVQAIAESGQHPAGTVVAGIPWKPEFTELDLVIRNETERAFKDINIVIRPDEPVAAIAQETSWPGVVFEDKNDVLNHIIEIKSGGAMKATPFVLRGTDAGYRVQVSRLPGNSDVKVVLALCDFDSNKLRLPMDNPNSLVKERWTDSSSYWLARPEADVLMPLPQLSPSETMSIEGHYTAALRTRNVSIRIPVEGIISVCSP